MSTKAVQLCNWVWCFLGSLGVIFSLRGLYALMSECAFSNYDLNLLSFKRVIFFLAVLLVTAKFFRLEVY